MAILTVFVGCLAGVSFGMFMAMVFKGDVGVREAVMTGVTFLFYGVSGLFLIDIRLMVRRHLPILDRLNPMTLMSDAFQSLLVYETYARYFQSLWMLLFLTAFFCVMSAVALRRKRYANI